MAGQTPQMLTYIENSPQLSEVEVLKLVQNKHDDFSIVGLSTSI